MKRVLLGSAAAVVVGLLVFSVMTTRRLVQAYYLAEYQPEPLAEISATALPPAHRLVDVPWLAEPIGLPHSIALQMLAAQHDAVTPRGTVDFLMGTTWGATPLPRRTGFSPGQDPERGFIRAARQLGFQRRYLTTDDAQHFLRAVRVQISSGRAVRVAVDRSMLLQASGLLPHSLVLVGFDGEGFEFYDPTCEDAAHCAQGERGVQGHTLSAEKLLLAEQSLALAMQYPWTYQLTVLERGQPAADLEEALDHNARALIGETGRGPSSGSFLVLDTAKALRRHGQDVATPELIAGVQLAARVRQEDAMTLLVLFPAKPELSSAAEQLREAGRAYDRAALALTKHDPEAAATALEQAAALDSLALRSGERGPTPSPPASADLAK